MQEWALSYVLRKENEEKVERDNDFKKIMIFAVSPERYRNIFLKDEETPDLDTVQLRELDQIMNQLDKKKEISAADIIGNNDAKWI